MFFRRNTLGFGCFIPVFTLSILVYLSVHYPVGYFEEFAVGEFIRVLCVSLNKSKYAFLEEVFFLGAEHPCIVQGEFCNPVFFFQIKFFKRHLPIETLFSYLKSRLIVFEQAIGRFCLFASLINTFAMYSASFGSTELIFIKVGSFTFCLPVFYECFQVSVVYDKQFPMLAFLFYHKHRDFVFSLCEFFNLLVQVPYCWILPQLALYKEGIV